VLPSPEKRRVADIAMGPIARYYSHVASLVSRSEEYSITVPKANGRAYVVHTDDKKLWDEYVYPLEGATTCGCGRH
jgi:hypothetical protein